ncbi:MAG: 2-oxoacid:acceptor oxidoreductase subunit alpha, partial [Candidatus Aminicenantes bacterium]|nr:2-oxoacid:acceptor oxidoreductase subunit alpha [Candidatus Aminicenantes bacterium]
AVAVKKVRTQGKKISSLVIQTLYPLPEKVLHAALDGVKKVVVPEMNMGQYILDIKRLVEGRAEVIGVNKMNTSLLSPEMILEKGGLL